MRFAEYILFVRFAFVFETTVSAYLNEDKIPSTCLKCLEKYANPENNIISYEASDQPIFNDNEHPAPTTTPPKFNFDKKREATLKLLKKAHNAVEPRSLRYNAKLTSSSWPFGKQGSKGDAITSRADELTPEEREERINKAFARFVQLLTFFGHVDNFLTDKATSLLKIMGKAVDSDGNEEGEDVYYPPPNRYRRVPPRLNIRAEIN